MTEQKKTLAETVWSIRRVTSKKYTTEEKVRIVLEGLRREHNYRTVSEGSDPT
jgi:transposase-like protein